MSHLPARRCHCGEPGLVAEIRRDSSRMINKSSERAGTVDGAPQEISVVPDVLVLCAAYEPSFRQGGPVRSLGNLLPALQRHIRVAVITLDRDLGEGEPLPGIISNRWQTRSGVSVLYLSAGLLWLPRFINALFRARARVLYLNSFFDWRFSILVLLLRRFGAFGDRRVIVAPRGEFSSGALALKPRKKRFYLACFRRLQVGRGLIWHATSPLEAEDIRRELGGTIKVVIAPNFPDVRLLDAPGKSTGKVAGHLSAVYLSRITPKKNLAAAIEALLSVKEKITFSVYGPIGDRLYWSRCLSLASKLPDNVHFHYLGAVEHSGVQDVLAKAELFVLPTLGENYGHAIVEALLCGCPVLISDQTPWSELEERGAGWCTAPRAVGDIAARINECARLSRKEHDSMRHAAALYGRNIADIENLLDDYRRMFAPTAG